jgi:hypothetical protein
MRRLLDVKLAFAAIACALGLATASTPASGDSTPIGALPKGPTVTIATQRGSLVAVALPRQPAATGLVWRLARGIDQRVLREVSEADVGPSVVVVYRAVGKGHASVIYALTRGDASSKALRAIRHAVRVT